VVKALDAKSFDVVGTVQPMQAAGALRAEQKII
jgi:hypothetical protein